MRVCFMTEGQPARACAPHLLPQFTLEFPLRTTQEEFLKGSKRDRKADSETTVINLTLKEKIRLNEQRIKRDKSYLSNLLD